MRRLRPILLIASAFIGVACANKVEPKIQTTLEAVQLGLKNTNTRIGKLSTQLGNNVGGNYTTDSLTTLILAGGLIIFLLAGLAFLFWYRATGCERVATRVIQTVERARKYVPCDCGECADCIARKLGAMPKDRTAKMLHKRVKAATGS